MRSTCMPKLALRQTLLPAMTVPAIFFTATGMTDENLDILLNMVGHPWFTKETIAKEQGIIGQEIKMYDDSPDWRLLTALFRCLYKSHPIRDDIAGTTQSIAELTPELLYACTDAFYRPGNMVLSVAGNITLDQAVEACRRNGVYDAVEPPQVETIFPQEADTVQHKETTFTMPVNKPLLCPLLQRKPPSTAAIPAWRSSQTCCRT